MLIITVLLAIAFLILLFYFLYYKRQVKNIGEQLAFISAQDSFKQITTQIKPQEITSLVELCNTLLHRQRELNQQFSRRNEEISATIVSLSHDIRTPLTSLDGYLQLAKRAKTLEEQSQYIQMAESRIQPIHVLVDELFLYTKLQNPDYNLEFEPVDMINVLQKCLLSFMEDFSQKGTEPDITLPEEAIEMEGNQQALERVYENIIKNYMVHGKGILKIEYEKKDGQGMLYFTNRMKQDQALDVSNLFTRFYKEDPSRTNHSSGLGLSIVKSLVEKMNGSVEVDVQDYFFCIRLAFTKLKKGEER